jgi:hypothetical protein
MRTMILTATAAALSLAACGGSNAEPAGPTVQRDYQVGAFDRLEVAGPFDVTVTTGGQPSVHASGPSNLLDKMEVKVEGGVLKIRPKKRNSMFNWNFGRDGKATIAISVPMLSEAAIAGSGGIAIDKISGARFEGGIAGSGDMRLGAIDAGEVELSIAGSGDVTAAGKAKSVRYEIAGSGDIDAKGLVAETARVSIAGSGNVAANATGTAQVEMVGSGNVTVTGGAKCTTDKAGSGEVTCS